MAFGQQIGREVRNLVEHPAALQGRLEVIVARRPPRAHLGAYHSVDHHGVSVSPVLHTVVQVYQVI